MGVSGRMRTQTLVAGGNMRNIGSGGGVGLGGGGGGSKKKINK